MSSSSASAPQYNLLPAQTLHATTVATRELRAAFGPAVRELAPAVLVLSPNISRPFCTFRHEHRRLTVACGTMVSHDAPVFRKGELLPSSVNICTECVRIQAGLAL